VSILTIFALATLAPDDWPLFRGPAGTGLSSESRAPATWAPDKNIRWKTPLAHPGNGSPIVAAGRVFLVGAQDAGGERRWLGCFDRKDGRPLWERVVPFGKKMPTHDTNPHSSSTPASDGRRVVAWHDSAGLFCYDLDGKELWSRALGEFAHMWGHGASPVIHAGKIILNCSPGKQRNYVTAINLEDGKTLWETEEPFQGDGDRNAAGEYMGSWCTPLIATVGGQTQILVTQPTRLVAYDPASGKILWWCAGVNHPKGDLAYSSPVVIGDVCMVVGGFGGPALSVKMGGSGDVTAAQRLWRRDRNAQSIGSGVAIDGRVYLPFADAGLLECRDPASGKTLWQARASGGAFWGSIVQAGGMLYVTDQAGATVVFKPNPEKFEPVAVNKLGEPSNSTPAISDGQIFIRTFRALYCIGE
jgi:outer membrane protein assembly factor BamB